MMTVYEKLATARVEFQNRKPRMSGKNSFAGYSYFELSDILPVINQIGSDMGFVCVVSFLADSAMLEFCDTEKPDDRIVFKSPMSTASLKGCHEVQNLGAVETYIKRYLYQNAFEIVESDVLNMTNDPNKPVQSAKPDDPDRARCLKAQKTLGWTVEQLTELKARLGSYRSTAEHLEGLIVDKEASNG